MPYTPQDSHDLLIAHGYEHVYHEPVEHGYSDTGPLSVDPDWHEYTSLTETLYAYRKGVIDEREPMSPSDQYCWVFEVEEPHDDFHRPEPIGSQSLRVY